MYDVKIGVRVVAGDANRFFVSSSESQLDHIFTTYTDSSADISGAVAPVKSVCASNNISEVTCTFTLTQVDDGDSDPEFLVTENNFVLVKLDPAFILEPASPTACTQACTVIWNKKWIVIDYSLTAVADAAISFGISALTLPDYAASTLWFEVYIVKGQELIRKYTGANKFSYATALDPLACVNTANALSTAFNGLDSLWTITL